MDFFRSLARILAGRPQVPSSLQDNAVLKVLLDRRSVRSFTDRPISDDVFSAIIEAGRLAPSTVNLQTWSFAAFTAETWRATFDSPIPFRAPRAVLIMADTHRDKIVLDAFPHSPLVEYTVGVTNASLAAMAMNIAAEALGVSSVMLSETGRSGFLDARYLRDKLELPAGVIALMTIVLGYASGPYPPMPPKLPREQICFESSPPTYRAADPQIMTDWRAQMIAGYKASHLFSSFDNQLRIYRSKIGQAEADLQEMVLRPGDETHRANDHVENL